MDFIITNPSRMELEYLEFFQELDIDIGTENDFEITLNSFDASKQEIDFGYCIYVQGKEYGGIVEDKDISANDNTIKLLGYTWRGLLKHAIIEPPNGSAYLKVVGEANSVIRSIIQGRFGGLFETSLEQSGINVDYQFSRYVNILSGITDMLATKNSKLEIKAEQGEAGQPFRLVLKAVPVFDYSEEIEYSQDSKVNFNIRDYRRGINHLICLGKGELQERIILHLYVQGDGGIGDTKYYTGLQERTEVYDYSSAEDINALKEYGIKKLVELQNYKKLEVLVRDVDLELGDFIAGRDRYTNTYIKRKIAGKILKATQKDINITYKVEGE